MTLESPGMEPAVARRAIFDRVPAEVRYGGEPRAADVQPIELIPFVASGALDFAPLLGTETFAVSTGPTNSPGMLALAAAPDADMAAILATSYLGLRDVIAAQVSIDDGVASFVDRPGVVSFSIDLGMKGDEPTVTSRVDLWHRSLGAIPTRGSGASLADSRLMAGVVEHVAEGLAMEAGLDDPGLTDGSIGVRSVFEAAAAAGIPTLVLQDRIPSGIPYEAQARALIEEALEAGDLVIVPAEPVPMAGRDRLGWWRVDPVTGVTADMMDDGTASATVEISLIYRTIACAAVFMPAYTQVMSAVFSGTAQTLAGIASGMSAAYWIWNAKNVPVILGACATGTVPG